MHVNGAITAVTRNNNNDIGHVLRRGAKLLHGHLKTATFGYKKIRGQDRQVLAILPPVGHRPSSHWSGPIVWDIFYSEKIDLTRPHNFRRHW